MRNLLPIVLGLLCSDYWFIRGVLLFDSYMRSCLSLQALTTAQRWLQQFQVQWCCSLCFHSSVVSWATLWIQCTYAMLWIRMKELCTNLLFTMFLSSFHLLGMSQLPLQCPMRTKQPNELSRKHLFLWRFFRYEEFGDCNYCQFHQWMRISLPCTGHKCHYRQWIVSSWIENVCEQLCI